MTALHNCPDCTHEKITGYQCFGCNRRYAPKGKTPNVWVETFCDRFTGVPCEMTDVLTGAKHK